jgi:hypothetical protein
VKVASIFSNNNRHRTPGYSTHVSPPRYWYPPLSALAC